PLNNLGVTAVGYNNKEGIATSMGHAPMVAMVDAAAGSRMAISEARTNVVWAPLKDGIKGISLSANWMWPCRNEGEDARLYKAVKGASDFSCALGINIPTGKDSMSMTQKYPSGEKVLSPGTVIISTVAPVEDINKIVHPNLQNNPDSVLMYIPFVDGAASAAAGSDAKEAFPLGGSAFAQIVGQVGNVAPDVENPEYFAAAFKAVQEMVSRDMLLAGHDISAGGMITTALEMCFANVNGGLAINARALEMIAKEWGSAAGSVDIFKALFSETPGVLVQVEGSKVDEIAAVLDVCGAKGYVIGNYLPARKVVLTGFGANDAVSLDIDALRDIWFKTSYLFDIRQVGETCAKERFVNYKKQPLVYKFPEGFTGSLSAYSGVAAPVAESSAALAPDTSAPVAAIIREKGSNGDREMAWALHLAGFRVKDVHMTDLISGRETLEEVKMIVFVGGFSNADTLGSAKGWAGAFLYNAKAKAALDAFYAREDTMSLGICNGCQLMAELGLLTPTARELSPKMIHNNSHKYESAFVGVGIENSPSIMLSSLAGSKLGIWVAHGEGKFSFPENFTGSLSSYSGVAAPVAEGSSALAPAADAPIAAIIREKGSNGDREMAWALHLAGFRVKDVHMTDLISGR
ncbi:MAG: phosphoribosylformylglycinamidine synthase subunit PurQ, partial [Bacteroidales bacterium]|nr:phosphoribosylformylglycinamidine synthase subunit PurQ [Bacteroidales bacterium]